MRIALVHAVRHSIAPIEDAFRRLWPEARLMNLLDDSLSDDLVWNGSLTPRMTQRFVTLGRYAADTGADGILFTCTGFGLCIDACRYDLAPLAVLKPNEAMIEEAVVLAGPSGRIGLLGSFAPMLASVPAEFTAVAPDVIIVPSLAEGALAALDRGDEAGHDDAVMRAALELADCDVIALGQFSQARLAERIAAATGKPVLTTPDSALRKLQRLLLTAKAA
jgi:hypothetical protein